MNTTQTPMVPELLRTWKVRTTTNGAILTINGREFDIGATASALAFELERAAQGLNAPGLEHTDGSRLLEPGSHVDEILADHIAEHLRGGGHDEQDENHPLPDFSLPCVECDAPVYLGDEDEHGAEFAVWCDRCAARETEEDEAAP